MNTFFLSVLALFATLLGVLGYVLYSAARRSRSDFSPVTSAILGAGLAMAVTLGLFALNTALTVDPIAGFLWSDVLESLPAVLLIGAFVAVCVGVIFGAVAASTHRLPAGPESVAKKAAEPRNAADSR